MSITNADSVTHHEHLPSQRFSDQVPFGETFRSMEVTHHPAVAGVGIIEIVDPQTGIHLYHYTGEGEGELLANKAWLMTTISRSPDNPVERRKKFKANGAEKLRGINEIGHSAPAGMVGQLFFEAAGIPLTLAMVLYHLVQLHQGQEASTRFQGEERYGQLDLIDIGNHLPNPQAELVTAYNRLGKEAQETFLNLNAKTIEAFTSCWKPEGSSQEKGLYSRALDAVRRLHLGGKVTGAGIAMDARTTAQLIGQMKGLPDPHLRILAAQIENILNLSPEGQAALDWTPPAPELIRHTEANTHLAQNLQQLRQYFYENNLDSELLTQNPPVRFADVLRHGSTDSRYGIPASNVLHRHS